MPLEFQSESYTPSQPTEITVFTVENPAFEDSTSTYTVQLRGPGGAIIANTAFTAIELTLIDEVTRIPINSRVDQDVLDAAGAKLGQNNVVITTQSLLTWSVQATDNVIVAADKSSKFEWHRAIFKFEFDSGSGAEIGFHEVRIPVQRRFQTQLPTVN